MCRRVKRRSHWKQETPAAQVKAILGSIAGHVSNLIDETAGFQLTMPKIRQQLDEVQDIVSAMRGGATEWEDQNEYRSGG